MGVWKTLGRLSLLNIRKREIDPNFELSNSIMLLEELDRDLRNHLALIILNSGPTGRNLRQNWSVAQRVAVRKASATLTQRWEVLTRSRVSEAQQDLNKLLDNTISQIKEEFGFVGPDHEYHVLVLKGIHNSLKRNSRSMSRQNVSDLFELGLSFMIGLKWLPNLNDVDKNKIKSRLSTHNSRMLQVHQDAINRSIGQGETALNAGVSFMWNQSARGDGTLIATIDRLVFVYDDERIRNFSIQKKDISDFTFRETVVVPMSQELEVHYIDNGRNEQAFFFIGDYFSTEINNWLA